MATYEMQYATFLVVVVVGVVIVAGCMFRGKKVFSICLLHPPGTRSHVFAYMNRALCMCTCVDGFNFAPKNLHEAMASLRAATRELFFYRVETVFVLLENCERI